MSIPWVDAMLHEWARWARQDRGLGYPRESIEGRAMREGPAASQRRGWQPVEMPDHVEAVESAVLRMPHDLREVVLSKYFKPGTDAQKAKRDLKISERSYRDRLDRAHYYLAGMLQAA